MGRPCVKILCFCVIPQQYWLFLCLFALQPRTFAILTAFCSSMLCGWVGAKVMRKFAYPTGILCGCANHPRIWSKRCAWKSVKIREMSKKKGKCQWKNVKIRDNFFDRFEQTLNPELLHNLCFFSRLPLVSPDFQGSCHGGLRYRCSRGWTWFDAWRSSRSCSAHEKY